MILAIDDHSPVPAYDQLREQLADAILGGRIVPGERLAPIRQLARDLGLAPGTVARAYRELEGAGLIETRVPHGTFALAPSGATADRRDEISAVIEAAATRLARLGLSATDAARLLQHRMSQP